MTNVMFSKNLIITHDCHECSHEAEDGSVTKVAKKITFCFSIVDVVSLSDNIFRRDFCLPVTISTHRETHISGV